MRDEQAGNRKSLMLSPRRNISGAVSQSVQNLGEKWGFRTAHRQLAKPLGFMGPEWGFYGGFVAMEVGLRSIIPRTQH